MNKIFSFIGMTVGGWIGWEAGAPVSVFTAYMLSAVGTGVGLYVALRVAKRILP